MPVVRMVEIRDTPLDVAEVLEALDDVAAGGVNIFVGRVRDHDGRQGVVGLDYSAHPTALAELQRVADTIAEKHDVVALAAVHRVGKLALGDIAVIVGVAAGHRGEAYDASRDLIDTLKATVPIWKHQMFDDGTDEWVGTP